MQQLFEFLTNHYLLSGALLLAVAGFAANEVFQAIAGVKKISPRLAVAAHNRDEAVFLDIRSEADFNKGHIASALNIPATALSNRLNELKKHAEKTIIVVCQTGMSAGSAANQIRKNGLENVNILGGGVQGWLQAELPLTKGK